jgi:hypothetical protein
VTGNGGEDDGEDGDDDGAEEGDPEGATEEEFADVRFANGDGTEGSLRAEGGGGQSSFRLKAQNKGSGSG